jgi:hypothetical protein
MSFRFRALVEDRDHEQMLRGLVDRLGRGAGRSLRVEPYPPGRGSGEQHVRRKFPQFVADLRSKRFQEGLWGIVVIDGDVEGAAARRRRLLESIDSPLTTAERIVLLVPTRNVQTWGWRLLGHEVNESDDYKHLVERARESLRQLFEKRWPDVSSPPETPSSLRDGWLDWSRIS